MINQWWTKLKGIIKQGLTPSELALCTCISFVLTIVPVFGITTFILTFTSIRLKLNITLTITLSYLFYPMQFFCFIPFLKTSEWVFSLKETGLSLQLIETAIKTDFLKALTDFGTSIALAVVVWAIFSVLLFGPLYFFLLYLFKLIEKRSSFKMNKDS